MAKPSWRWLLIAGLAGFSALSIMKVVHGIQDGLHPEAVAVEGKPEIYAGTRGGTILYIGSKSFSLRAIVPGPKPWERIDPKTTYRVYYLRHSERPLSMEPVATDGKPE